MPKRAPRRTKREQKEWARSLHSSDELPNLSERFLEFAEPLVILMVGDPPRLEEVNFVATVASVCWNLPVFERINRKNAKEMRATYDKLLTLLPAEAKIVVEDLLEARLETYGDDLRVATVDVVEQGGQIRIVAASPTDG